MEERQSTDTHFLRSHLDIPVPPKWRTWLPLWARELIWQDGKNSYDAFLSYSWAADSKVAPVIKRVLETFLHPWYKSRAKYIFHDLACLPVGSSLRGELKRRLDVSRHLIVLASPEAHSSEGMEFETKAWFESKRSGEVIILITSGTYRTWEDLSASALPPSLSAALTDEPLFVDLSAQRQAILNRPDDGGLHGELTELLKQVLLRLHPGSDWEQLRGLESVYRRRARFWAGTLITVLLILTLAATTEAVRANRAQTAEREARALAEVRRQDAENQRKVATERASEAEKRKQEAESQTRVATSQSLSALSQLFRDTRGDLSLLLSAQAQVVNNTFQSRDALISGLQSNPRLERYIYPPYEPNRSAAPSSFRIAALALLPKRDWIVVAGAGRTVRFFHASAAREVRSPLQLNLDPNKLRTGYAAIFKIIASPSGERLAFDTTDGIWVYEMNASKAYRLPDIARPGTIPGDALGAFNSDGSSLITVVSGLALRFWRMPGGAPSPSPSPTLHSVRESVAFSPNGAYFAAGSQLWRTDTWEELIFPRHQSNYDRLKKPLHGQTGAIAFSPNNRFLLLANEDGTIGRLEIKTLQVSDLVPSGSAADINDVAFSPNGQYFAAGTSGGTVHCWRTETWLEAENPYSNDRSALHRVIFSDDSRLLITLATDNRIRVFAAPSSASLGQDRASYGTAPSMRCRSIARKRSSQADRSHLVRTRDKSRLRFLIQFACSMCERAGFHQTRSTLPPKSAILRSVWTASRSSSRARAAIPASGE